MRVFRSGSLIFAVMAMLASHALAASGDLDPTFGGGGKVVTSNGYKDDANAVAIQSDGKIVVAGSREMILGDPHSNYALLARYNPDGSLDTSFGIGGFVTDFAHAGHTSYFRAVKVQPDGKIIAAGYFFENGGCLGDRSWAVRYNPDGTPDVTFGGDGEIEYLFHCVTTSTSYINGIAIQPNGKIVFAGASLMSSGNLDYAVARVNSDGTPDTNFSSDGFATFAVGSADDVAFGVAVHPTNGEIALAGYSVNSSGNKDFGIVSLTSSGALDVGFGVFGRVSVNFAGKNDEARAVVFQTDGKILAGGYATTALLDLPDARFALARFNASGSLDSTFGSSGKVTTNFGAFSDSASGIALQTNGRIVSAGTQTDPGGTAANFGLTRHNSNGTIDTTFSGDGKQTTDFNSQADYGRAVAIQADGRIVVVGRATNGADYDIALARYEP